MKGFIRKTMLGVALSAGLCSLGGCVLYRQLVDPCWPERYAHQARMSVREIHNAQAAEGHALDQTIWGWHFERDPKTHEPRLEKGKDGKETAVLTSGGREHLKLLAYRVPAADPMIFYQRDLDDRVNLSRERAIQDYLRILVRDRSFLVQGVNVRDIQPVVPGDLRKSAETTIDYQTPFQALSQTQ